MIFFKHNRRLDAKRRFGSREFQAKVKHQQTYRRVARPIDLTRKSRWLVILGFRSRAVRIIWVGAIAVLAYFFIFSDYMVVSDVSVVGTKKIDPNQIREIVTNMGSDRTFFIPKANFFLLTKSRLNQRLLASQPFVKEVVKYDRIWPNKAVIEIIERDPGFIIVSGEYRYLIDDEGLVVTDDPKEEGLPIVQDQVIENFDNGKPIDNTKLVTFILSMHKQWNSKISSPIAETKIPGKAASEVQFVSAEGWGVFFDTNRSVASQLNSLALILSKEIPSASRPNLAYIDLRLSKWAYYCYHNTPCVAGSEVNAEQENPDQAN